MTDPKATGLPMDQYVDLLKRWREATKARQGWQKIEDQIKSDIDTLLGDIDTGTVNGEEAVLRRWEDRFATGQFKKDDPDTARFFEMETTVRVVDVEMIKRTRPDIYRRYQTSKLINKFDA